jgi:hypothetical protein
MAKRTSGLVASTKRRARARFKELADELGLLLVSFPDLADAFDADELPVSFILKRDGQRAEAKSARLPPRRVVSAEDAKKRRMKI